MNIFLSRYEEILRFSLLFYYPERRFIYAPASVTHMPSVWVGGKHLNSFEIPSLAMKCSFQLLNKVIAVIFERSSFSCTYDLVTDLEVK